MNKVSLRMRLDAAAHELTCWECRVSWTCWLLRLFGWGGYSPRIRCGDCNRKFTGDKMEILVPGQPPICHSCLFRRAMDI